MITYDKNEDAFRLSLFSEESVPLFGPTLPCPPVFHNHQEFREFLLVKCEYMFHSHSANASVTESISNNNNITKI